MQVCNITEELNVLKQKTINTSQISSVGRIISWRCRHYTSIMVISGKNALTAITLQHHGNYSCGNRNKFSMLNDKNRHIAIPFRATTFCTFVWAFLVCHKHWWLKRLHSGMSLWKGAAHSTCHSLGDLTRKKVRLRSPNTCQSCTTGAHLTGMCAIKYY